VVKYPNEKCFAQHAVHGKLSKEKFGTFMHWFC